MWTSATFPRQKLHMGAWNPTIFAFWHIITRKDTAMQPLRQGSSTLPGHLGFFLMGGKFLCSQMPYRTVQRELKRITGGCPALEAMKLLQGIIQTKSLYSWRKRKCFCTASLNLSYLLASLFFPVLKSSLLPVVTLHKGLSLPLFLIFPLRRSPLFDLPLRLIPGTSLLLTRTHTGLEERL